VEPESLAALRGMGFERELACRTLEQARPTRADHHMFGVIGAALSKKISIFQSSSLKVVPITPNASH
jgi:hypothetical protein